MSKHRPFVVVCAVTFLLCLISFQSEAAQPDRQYLTGYAEAILHQVLGLRDTQLKIVGEKAVVSGNLSATQIESVCTHLKKINGIEGVEFPSAKAAFSCSGKKIEKWTKRLLFSPPIADLRAPRFSAGWQSYRGNTSLTNVGAVSFGETLTIADFTGDEPKRKDLSEGTGEIAFQGAVFSIFDLDGTSKDLVNSDFWAAVTYSYRQRPDWGDFSYMARAFHQSSHLGDEYILFNKITDRDRVNVSYEGLDLTLAAEPNYLEGWRLYGGGGMLLRREPTTLNRWSAKAGVEWVKPEKLWRFYPLAAAHIQASGQHDWHSDISLAAGVQFRDHKIEDRQVRLLLSYFNGYSPNGQFYDEQLKYFSLGLQYQF